MDWNKVRPLRNHGWAQTKCKLCPKQNRPNILSLRLVGLIAASSFFKICIYLFLAARVFAAARGLSLVAASGGYSPAALCRLLPCSGFSCCRARALGARTQQLQCEGSAASQHLEFFQIREGTCVPCIGRWILNHWTTRKAQQFLFLPPSFIEGILTSKNWIYIYIVKWLLPHVVPKRNSSPVFPCLLSGWSNCCENEVGKSSNIITLLSVPSVMLVFA